MDPLRLYHQMVDLEKGGPRSVGWVCYCLGLSLLGLSSAAELNKLTLQASLIFVEKLVNHLYWTVLNYVIFLIKNTFTNLSSPSLGPTTCSCHYIHGRLPAHDAPGESFKSRWPLREVRHPVPVTQRHHLADQVHPERRLQQEIAGIGFQRVHHCKYQDLYWKPTKIFLLLMNLSNNFSDIL